MADFPTQPTPAAAAGEAGAGTNVIDKKPIARGMPDLNAGNTALEGLHMAQQKVRPGQGSIKMEGDTEPTKEEQAEYDRAVNALGTVMYEDERGSAAVAKQLQPDEKIGSVAKASILLVQQLDQQLDFDEVIIPQFTQEVVGRVIDMYENVHQDEFSDQESQRAFGAAWEGVMDLFGVDEDSYAELTAGMSDEEFGEYESQYKSFLGEA